MSCTWVVSNKALRSDPAAHSPPWGRKRMALVVAEDSQARRHLKEALSRVGYAAEVSDDVEAIRNHGKASGPSLLVLESGEAAINVVRQLRHGGADTPVILLSSGPGAEEPRIDPDVAFVEHLSTPYTLKSLQLAIAKVTGWHG